MVWSVDQLETLFKGFDDRSIIVDLVRPGFTPFFAAEQICRQTGIDHNSLLADLPTVLLPETGQIEGNHIASWLDFELFGDPVRIMADRICAALKSKKRDHLAILLPPSLEDITRADGFLIACLARGLSSIDLVFPAGPYALPPDWGFTLSLQSEPVARSLPCAVLPPGPLSPATKTKLTMLGHTLPSAAMAPNGLGYFAPEQRFGIAPTVSATLCEFARHWGFAGIAFVLDQLSPTEMARFAWRAMAAHDGELAIRLARQALLQPGDTSFARTSLATLYIINQTYGDLSEPAVASPTDRLNAAWGSAVVGDAAAAVVTFGETEWPDSPVIRLYLQNIAALACFRSGDTVRAWELQRAISEALPLLVPPSAHLDFLNNLNMCRLARAGGDYTKARALLAAAFHARAGQLSEHDLFYEQVLMAGLVDDAQTVWQRARAIFEKQLHPGAIPLRSFRNIVGRPPRRFELREIAVLDALDRKIAQTK